MFSGSPGWLQILDTVEDELGLELCSCCLYQIAGIIGMHCKDLLWALNSELNAY